MMDKYGLKQIEYEHKIHVKAPIRRGNIIWKIIKLLKVTKKQRK